MSRRVPPVSGRATDLHERFAAFVTERYPLAATRAINALAAAVRNTPRDVASPEDWFILLRARLAAELRDRLNDAGPSVAVDTTPGVPVKTRFQGAVEDL